VDGFRVDVANFLLKDPELRDNPPNPALGTSAYKSLGPYDAQLHLYDKGHPDIHRLYQRFRRVLDAYSAAGAERIALGEIHLFDWPNWTRQWAVYYGELLDELHLSLNLTLVGLPWAAERFRRAINAVEVALPRGAWPTVVLGSHDEPRMASRIGVEQARAAMRLVLTLRGTPILYYGDEIGLTNVNVPPERARNPFGALDPALGREPERTPMQWDASANAGFCVAGIAPWLPVGQNVARVSVAVQRWDPRSILTLTRRVLALRRARPALQFGAYTPVDAPTDCMAYLRERGGDRVFVALNFGAEDRKVALPVEWSGQVLVSTWLDRQQERVRGRVRLRAHEGCLVELPE
jgi:glycosidase